ncbi:uncharacterized protein, partial [Mobula birostris]|uniref:uncharacterized protein n=1 Tax=Mobula birostris TaxID=1983395 RepID=UPI003B287897
MDESETYMNFAKTNSGILRKASRDILSSTYSELKTGKEEPLSNKEQDPAVASGRGELPITAQTEGMNSTYSVLNLRKDEPLIHEYEDPPIASGPAELSVTAQADEPDVSYVEINFQRLSEPRPQAAGGPPPFSYPCRWYQYVPRPLAVLLPTSGYPGCYRKRPRTLAPGRQTASRVSFPSPQNLLSDPLPQRLRPLSLLPSSFRAAVSDPW